MRSSSAWPTSSPASQPDERGERLVRTYLHMWENPSTAGALLAIVRSAIASDRLQAILSVRMLRDLVPRLAQALATVPAVWAMIALALAAVGANPRVRLVGWLGVVATFAPTLLGPLFRLWDWILGISPLWHVPDVNATGADWSGLGWVAVVALFLTVVGLLASAAATSSEHNWRTRWVSRHVRRGRMPIEVLAFFTKWEVVDVELVRVIVETFRLAVNSTNRRSSPVSVVTS
jgi:hypothetical protein